MEIESNGIVWNNIECSIGTRHLLPNYSKKFSFGINWSDTSSKIIDSSEGKFSFNGCELNINIIPPQQRRQQTPTETQKMCNLQ